MPSGEITLQRIQREIYEVKLREEELRKKYANGDSEIETNITNGNGTISPPPMTNGTPKNEIFEPKPQQKTPVVAKSAKKNGMADIVLNLTNSKISSRRFAPNTNTKGVMQRFIKSKGKIGALTTLSNVPSSNMAWQSSPIEDTISPPKVTPGKQLRRGYVPVEERMKKEFQEMHHREHELKLERRKSQSDLLDMDEEEDKQVVSSSKMRSARSISHLSESDYADADDTQSEPYSLKPARSLAQLCDGEEEVDAPGSLTLIRQWESLIQKNQQLRT